MNSIRLRSWSTILLIAGGLLIALILGSLLLMRGTGRPPVAAFSDDEARQQVLEPARQFVSAGQLKAVNGTYLLLSCASEEKPPYQGAMYVNFDIPSIAETPVYFRQIAKAMTERGWHEGLPPGHHPGGHTMAKDGVVAYFYRDPDRAGRGLLEIRGECRDTSDHQRDTNGFVDVTAEIAG